MWHTRKKANRRNSEIISERKKEENPVRRAIKISKTSNIIRVCIFS